MGLPQAHLHAGLFGSVVGSDRCQGREVSGTCPVCVACPGAAARCCGHCAEAHAAPRAVCAPAAAPGRAPAAYRTAGADFTSIYNASSLSVQCS